MDPRDPSVPPSVTVEVNGTAAQLLVKLMYEMGTEDPMAVLTRSLGMLEQALAAKRQGRRLGVFEPETGRFMDVVL